MIPAAVTNAFNAQMSRELYSSCFYLALSAYGESLGLPGITTITPARSSSIGSSPSRSEEEAMVSDILNRLRPVGSRRPWTQSASWPNSQPVSVAISTTSAT